MFCAPGVQNGVTVFLFGEIMFRLKITYVLRSSKNIGECFEYFREFTIPFQPKCGMEFYEVACRSFRLSSDATDYDDQIGYLQFDLNEECFCVQILGEGLEERHEIFMTNGWIKKMGK